jgi:thioredoxin-like negative regulator of GroEL
MTTTHRSLSPSTVARALFWHWSVAIVGLSFLASPSRAQEISWREDYNAARREAQEKSMPLVLDFGTESCFWCKKLEETTLRDPAVAALIKERFIALKVDARRNAELTEALRIQSFPTIVLAGPDGKILGTLEGYTDATRFHEHLQRLLVVLSNPEWMTRDYEEAEKAVAAHEHARAVALLKSVVEDGKERPIQAKARQLLNDLEEQAAGRLAHAKQLEDQGQSTQAIDSLTELLKNYAGTQAAIEGGRALNALAEKPEVKAQLRTRRARELLTQAREDYRTQQYLCCMDRCEVLNASYADLPEAVEGMRLVAEIKNNPDWMRQACESLSDRLGVLYLSLAETWIKKGQPHEAVACLERVVQTLPGTRQAEVAQTRLAQLQGQPTGRADFKKP